MKTGVVPIIRLLLTIVTAASVVVAAEWGATSMLSQPAGPSLHRPNTIYFFRRAPSDMPSTFATPNLLLIGNSHTYALPGLHRGEILRDRSMASRPVLLDDIGADLARSRANSTITCYALAYPNFLPYEMLTRVAHLYRHGLRPNVVVLGVTWRNVARDSQLRPEVRRIFKDEPDFADAFEKTLRDPSIGADREAIDAIAVDARWAAAEVEKARLRSHADRLDEALADRIGENLTLLGGSGSLRARFNQAAAIPLQEWLQGLLGQRRAVYAYDLVEHDLDFNLKCLWALLRLFKHNGAAVVCYLAPERTDVQPLMDPVREAKFIPEFEREAERLGVVVLDARHVVPNEYWGWNGNLPDDSHFTEPGHERLADFLVTELERRGLLRQLGEAGPP